MISDLTNGRLAEIQAYAKQHNLEESLSKAYSRLERYSNDGCEVSLYNDFAPFSLYFEISSNGKFMLNGGMIFHGPHDGYGSGGAPTFSVCLERDAVSGWQIHT